MYKDTLRLLFQRHTPNSSRGRTGGSISAVQVETSLAGGHVGPQSDSSSFVILIDALRYFDACCHKVLEFWINKSKVQHLTQCFKHGNQPSALTQEPSRLLTERERQHPLVSTLTGRTKEQVKNLCSALSGAKEHNLGAASDTRMTMMQIWDFKTPFHVGPVASARKLENLVGSLPPSDNSPSSTRSRSSQPRSRATPTMKSLSSPSWKLQMPPTKVKITPPSQFSLRVSRVLALPNS